MKSTASAIFSLPDDILGLSRSSSRHSQRILFKPPHQTPPMDQIKRTKWLNWGLEAVSDEIDSKNRFGGQFANFQGRNWRVLVTRCKLSVGFSTTVHPWIIQSERTPLFRGTKLYLSKYSLVTSFCGKCRISARFRQ